MSGNSELNGLDPSKYIADQKALELLKQKFNNVIDPETLRQQLQSSADALISALPPVSGDAAGIGEAFTPDLSKYDLTQGWIEIATQFISGKEGFKETPPGSGISVAANDYGRPRLGYGTDRFFLPDGRIKTVEYGDSVDKPRALAMLKLDIAERFYKRVVGNGDNRIPVERWNELRDTQKAALISLAYTKSLSPPIAVPSVNNTCVLLVPKVGKVVTVPASFLTLITPLSSTKRVDLPDDGVGMLFDASSLSIIDILIL